MASEKSIIRKPKNKENPYVIISKSVFEDERISWKAKGLMGYLLSRPDDWQIIVGDLINRSTDGRDSVKAGLRELIKFGYLRREQGRDDTSGRFEAVVYEVYETPIELEDSNDKLQVEKLSTDKSPLTGNPSTGNPSTEKPLTENPPLLNNDLTNKQLELNNEINNNVVVDDPDPIKSLLAKHKIKVNAATLKAWRKKANDEIIMQVINDTLARPDVRDVVAYITSTFKDGYTPAVPSPAAQVSPMQQKSSKYDVFYQYYQQDSHQTL